MNYLLWYQHGEMLRKSGKHTIVTETGAFIWAIEGIIHRCGGKPAIIEANGVKRYYVDGNPYYRKSKYWDALANKNHPCSGVRGCLCGAGPKYQLRKRRREI